MQQLLIDLLTLFPLVSHNLQDPHVYCSHITTAIGYFSISQHGIMTSLAGMKLRILKLEVIVDIQNIHFSENNLSYYI